MLATFFGGLAQPHQFTLNGKIRMATGEEFQYKIVASETNDVVDGFSYTFSPPRETKTVIKGKLDRQHNKFTFRETEILSSHDIHTDAFMCMVNAKLENRGGVLSGSATSEEADKTSCTSGTITFDNGSEINELFSSHDKYDMAVTMGGHKMRDTVKPADVPVKKEVKITEDKITAGQDKSYEWYSDSVLVDIWDGGQLDGDVVTIEFDGKPILKNYTLAKHLKRVAVALTGKDVHTLSIIAVNEGYDPPNTASLMLRDGDTRYSILAYNPKGQRSLIKIKKVTP